MVSLKDIRIIEDDIHRDDRGYFVENYSCKTYMNYGITTNFVQDNISFSKKDVIRGIHISNQAKLVQCLHGCIIDVIVDIETKNYLTIMLKGGDGRHVYIPPGLGHAFIAMEDSLVLYKVDQYYDPKTERGIRWNDPQLNIAWNISDPIMSEKDKNLSLL